MFKARLKGMYEMSRQSPLATLFGIDDFPRCCFYRKPAADIRQRHRARQPSWGPSRRKWSASAPSWSTQLAELNAQEAELEQTPPWRIPMPFQSGRPGHQADAAAQAQAQEARGNRRGSTSRPRPNGARGRRHSTNGISYANGDFQWPIPGYTSLSPISASPRGIYGQWDVHRGMDVPPRRARPSMRRRTAWCPPTTTGPTASP
ncbi:MAG: hypothetical protein V8T36_07790 [Ruthenibacterium lactatiformans]